MARDRITDWPGLTIGVFPEHGHPSSLWPSKELKLIDRNRPYVMPDELGIDEPLGAEILDWTDYFQWQFDTEADDFDGRPIWKPGSDVYDWYDEGYRIVYKLRAQFPRVQIAPRFAKYVFSPNERRESSGRMPISLPGEDRAGYISIRELTPPWPTPIEEIG